MNRIYKTVWNAVRRCLVAVNEGVSGRGKQSSASGIVQGGGLALPMD